MELDNLSPIADSTIDTIDLRPSRVGTALRWMARNWFAIAFALLLLTPALAELSGFDQVDPAAENRVLATLPAWPDSPSDALHFPAALNTYLQDWFGLRQPMVRVNNWLRFTLFHEVTSPNLLVAKHGRIFLTSHPGGPSFSLVYDVCGTGRPDGYFLGAAYGLTALVERVSRDFPNFTFLIVPGATALYSEDLPRWAWAPCRGRRPSIERVLDDLEGRPDILAHIVYPIDVLQDLKRHYPVIPKLNIHWAGEGPLRYIEFLSERRFGMQPTLSVPMQVGDWLSDLNRLNPGLGLVNRIPWPAPTLAGVSRCFGSECPPLDQDPAVTALLDRYRTANPNGKRVLLFGDSFADNVAGDFTEYFGEVWHIHFNGLDQLTRSQLDRLFALAFVQFHPDQLIYICNDFGIFFEPALAQNFFWPNAVAPVRR